MTELGDMSEWGTPEGRHMIDLLWNPPAPAARGPKQKLTLDEIVETAMSIAGQGGIDGLTMRKVAAALGVSAMSLYTYVPGREELFELMIDRAWGNRLRPDRSRRWREQVEFHAEQGWAMYQAHPWLVWSNLWRMPLGPNVLDAQEDLYRAFDLAGLDPHAVAKLAGLVESHVFGAARSAIVDTRASASTGVSTDEYWASRASFWGTYYSAERFPTMTKIWESGGFDAEFGTKADMVRGLSLLLDGVALLVEQSSSRAADARTGGLG